MKKRVLVFTETALALSETFIAAHCRSLNRYDYTLLALSNSGDHHADIPRKILFGARKPGRLEMLAFRLGLSRAMDSAIAEINPDLIHAHYLMNGCFMSPYARRHNLPLVVTGHGYDVTRRLSPSSLYGLAYRLQRPSLIRSNALILPVSDYLRNRILADGFPPEQVRTHHLGIELSATPPVDVAAAPPRIVYAGRLVEKKGIDKVLQAFELVLKARPDAQLHIVGDGPLRTMVQEHASRMLAITYHRQQPPAVTQDIMAYGRVFTMPSREATDGDSEGFGLVLIEAQARGVPVVTSNQTGTAEAVLDGTTGFALEAQDVPGLANAYLSLLNDPDRARQMGEAAYNYVRVNFDIAKRTPMLEDIYDSLLQGHVEPRAAGI